MWDVLEHRTWLLIKRMGEATDVLKPDIPSSSLDATDVRSVEVGLKRELFLGDSVGESQDSQAVTEG